MSEDDERLTREEAISSVFGLVLSVDNDRAVGPTDSLGEARAILRALGVTEEEMA